MSKINYDLKKIRGVVFDVDGVLSPCLLPLGPDGVPCRMANLHDGYALQLAVRKGLKIAIISGATGDALVNRFRNLGINDIFLQAGVKKEILDRWLKDNNLSPEEVAYVGDDIPDTECLRAVGLSVAPADAAADVLDIVKYVSPVNGGYGVARDLLEEILKANDLWPSTDIAWGWNKR
ncbi:MAG: HAD hydrolase-like protein [Bacteroidales bacterium]|nr:HAD hydrolase-like protein [Bacteroidales bacterium]